MATKRLKILHEDNHLLAVAKPAGVPTMGAGEGVESVVDRAKAYLKEKYDKPGAVYLGVVSRLDKPVTGVLLFARTSKAAARLTEAFRTRKVEKTYLTTVVGVAPECDAPVVHHVCKDDRNQRVFVTHEKTPGAQRAELSYDVLATRDQRSLLAVRLQTGRKHQIRVQMAKLGMPILGDEKYGGPPAFKAAIALHAWRLTVEHPVKREPLRLVCPPESRWGGWQEEELRRAIRDV